MTTRARLVLLNKPYGVMCQFSGPAPTLAQYVDEPGVYPAGRLDKDSEGLVLLTDNGVLQARISEPRFKLEKTYWVQVEGTPDDVALDRLRDGVVLNDGPTRPARVSRIDAPLGPRDPPVRHRDRIETCWLQLVIREGRNRQVRRMTAAVGFPTLRLFRTSIGPWTVTGLAPGASRTIQVNVGEAGRRR